MKSSHTYPQSTFEKTLKQFNTRRLEPFSKRQMSSLGKIINDRYQIMQVLPSIDKLNCYTAKDHIDTGRCGMCGAENIDEPSEYCNQCGYYLPDSYFLLLEGNRESTRGFAPLISDRLKHQGILTFFEKFNFNSKYYVVAQNIAHKTLANCDPYIHVTHLLNWAIVLAETLDFLHRHSIFNIDMRLDHIAILAGGPRLINFSDSIVIEKSEQKPRLFTDIKAFAASFLMLLSNIEQQDRKTACLKDIFIKAEQQSFNTAGELIYALAQDPEKPKKLKSKQTVILSDRGVSISMGKASDVGIVRTLNEDSVVAFELTNILQSVSSPFGFYMVADGMGGHEAGEEASKMAVELITKRIIHTFNNNLEFAPNKAKQILEDTVFATNDEIYRAAKAGKNNMGTTITLALLVNMKAFIFNVGDARTFHYKRGKLELITQDHSLVYRLYKIGQLNYQDIPHHPNSNQILCALGEAKLQQSLNNMAGQANHPYYFNIDLERGDGLLLCSDGLWQMIPDAKIEQTLEKHHNPQQAVDQLVSMANRNGGDDNISLIFVKTY